MKCTFLFFDFSLLLLLFVLVGFDANSDCCGTLTPLDDYDLKCCFLAVDYFDEEILYFLGRHLSL